MASKTQEYLKTGYQRQLTYRHADGSFSAFGPNPNANISGGTWLTAFVLRSFADAYKLNHSRIDKRDLEASLFRLVQIQNVTDGRFDQLGQPLLSKALAGALEGGEGQQVKSLKVALSAYVIISVIKARDALGLKENSKEEDKGDDDKLMKTVRKGLAFLRSARVANELEKWDTYSLALVLYAFKLADRDEDASIVEDLIAELESRAIVESIPMIVTFIYVIIIREG